jgi:hypothetical protein
MVRLSLFKLKRLKKVVSSLSKKIEAHSVDFPKRSAISCHFEKYKPTDQMNSAKFMVSSMF